jgi:hypothetical protein
MADISLNKRNNQSSPLSQTQVDENWTILETAVNSKGEGSGTLTGVIITDNSNIINATVSNGVSSSTITVSDVGSLTANRVLASPNGSSGSPSYRALVNADLPIVAVTKGGTNSSAELNGNKVMVSSGSAIVESSTIDTTELSYLNGINALSNGILRKGTGVLSTASIDLTADVTGILPAANGGTGLNPSGSFANGKLLISTASGFALNTLASGGGGAEGSAIIITNGSGTVKIGVDTTALVPSGRTVNTKPLSGDIVLTTDDVSDAASSNKYFTNAAVNTQIDAYVTAAAPLVKTGGALTIVAANTTTNGYLTSADWNTFSDKIGGSFAQNTTSEYQIPNFDYDIWYTSANIILPNIGTNVGKIMFIKNTNTSANSRISPFAGSTINGASAVNLSHSAGGLSQGGIMIQAISATTWAILSQTGSIS